MFFLNSVKAAIESTRALPARCLQVHCNMQESPPVAKQTCNIPASVALSIPKMPHTGDPETPKRGKPDRK